MSDLSPPSGEERKSNFEVVRSVELSGRGADRRRGRLFAISYSPPGREVLRLSIAQDLCARCGQMRRREFMALIGNGVVAWPLAARAQQPAKLKPIAMVHPVEKAGNMTITGRRFFRAFFEKLGALGYVEGQNLFGGAILRRGTNSITMLNWLAMSSVPVLTSYSR